MNKKAEKKSNSAAIRDLKMFIDDVVVTGVNAQHKNTHKAMHAISEFLREKFPDDFINGENVFARYDRLNTKDQTNEQV